MEKFGIFLKSVPLNKLPKNTEKFYGGLTLLNMNCLGFVSISFTDTGDNLLDSDREEKDDKGNKIDDYVNIYTYGLDPEDDPSYLEFENRGGSTLLFSHESHPKGDIREFIDDALSLVGWPPYEDGEYILVGTTGCAKTAEEVQADLAGGKLVMHCE